jgi:hypothetical protein
MQESMALYLQVDNVFGHATYRLQIVEASRTVLSSDSFCPSSNRTSTSAQQVDDQNHQPYNQQQVDQTSTNVQTEAQKPQNYENNENRPKHMTLLCSFVST